MILVCDIHLFHYERSKNLHLGYANIITKLITDLQQFYNWERYLEFQPYPTNSICLTSWAVYNNLMLSYIATCTRSGLHCVTIFRR